MGGILCPRKVEADAPAQARPVSGVRVSGRLLASVHRMRANFESLCEMTQSDVPSTKIHRTSPPTEQGTVIRPKSPKLWLLICSMLVYTSCLNLLGMSVWIVLFLRKFTGDKAQWFWSDAAVRSLLWAMLLTASVFIMRQKRLGPILLVLWSGIYFVWIPISGYAAMGFDEPPIDGLILAIVSLYYLADVIALTTGCSWLLLPVIAVICVVTRPRR